MSFEVRSAGTQTTVQDLPGRQGLWGVGVPPSGAWDDLSFALANRAVGNPVGAAGLEAVLRGPVLRFRAPAVVCVAGAATSSTVDGVPMAPGRPVEVGAGRVLDVEEALGSRSTFLLGGFGGYAGRPLRSGDVVGFGSPFGPPLEVADALPILTDSWTIRAVPGPHGAPEYLTEAGAAALFSTVWRLDHRSDRTGVRLLGPVPEFARDDGGEAGLHPSNIHDSAYPVGAVMLSGATPVIVGPDGPSLGGFVVPAVVIRADRWRLAQCRPGDRIRLLPVTPDQADEANADRARLLGTTPAPHRQASYVRAGTARPAALVDLPADQRRLADPAQVPADKRRLADPAQVPADKRRPADPAQVPAHDDDDPDPGRPALTVRRAGDHHLLVELGPAELDLAVRLRVRLLAAALGTPPGVVESVEGVRSLLLAVDESRLSLPALAEWVTEAWQGLPQLSTVEIAAREVRLPIAFDDPAAHEAMTRYQTSVRWDAPWCPDNVEFIRRINGLRERHEVFDIVAAATYLVVGLGDVYLGAPVAVPLDPAHRLVTTKYDPPRTWTPANAVGIGGAYLCVYGMAGPGGYQLVGRTVPVWRTGAEPPWLLRQFDLLRFEPVSHVELRDLRADVAAGRRELRTRPRTLRLADLIRPGGPGADEFTARRRAAFAAERDRWALATGAPV